MDLHKLVLGAGFSIILCGCSLEEEVVPIAIPASDENVAAGRPVEGGPSVEIERFKDVRRDKPWLGTRIGRFGAMDGYTFVVAGGDVGVSTSLAIRRFLRARGWDAVADGGTAPNMPDIVLHGEIRQLRVEGLNGWFTTTLTCTVNLLVRGENRSDGSVVTLPLAATETRVVRWFDTDDVEQLVNEVLEESFAQLVGATRFEGSHLVAIQR